jgi:hypothetical protein
MELGLHTCPGHLLSSVAKRPLMSKCPPLPPGFERGASCLPLEPSPALSGLFGRNPTLMAVDPGVAHLVLSSLLPWCHQGRRKQPQQTSYERERDHISSHRMSSTGKQGSRQVLCQRELELSLLVIAQSQCQPPQDNLSKARPPQGRVTASVTWATWRSQIPRLRKKC